MDYTSRASPEGHRTDGIRMGYGVTNENSTLEKFAIDQQHQLSVAGVWVQDSTAKQDPNQFGRAEIPHSSSSFKLEQKKS